VSLTYTDSFRDIPAAIRQIRDSDCYYVFARDHCGNQSDGSNQGCIIVLDAKNQPGYNDLSWNSYQTWPDGIQSYNVYKNEDSTGWQLIGTTSSVQVNEFKDRKLGDSTIDFCYQVQAIENPGQYNQLSRSTVECVHQDATVFIPNSFTPYNQDGLNDLFGPKGAYIKNYSMKIYNRWGEQVYSTSSGADWDGTNHGQFVQQGVYIYLITVIGYNGKQSYFKGTVTMFE
jgi:gliding motility-associated-like protein